MSALNEPSSASIGTVASSVSAVTLIAAGAGPHGRIVYNSSTAVLYLAFGSGASSTNYTVQVPTQGTYDFGARGSAMYDGIVTGAWASANGNALVTTW